MAERVRPDAILIAGPTASGKSALALRLAREIGGSVVNADSMQVYDGLRILSARPSEADMGGVPHHLYGHRDPAIPYSVGDWLREVEPLVASLRAEGRIPVFCGGTGLYFRALLGGLDEMPTVPEAVRRHWRTRMAEEGPARLHAVLAGLDPEAAERIRPSDPQRIARALELAETRVLLGAQRGGGAGRSVVEPDRVLKIVIAPDRALLRERIARRFEAMLEEGALAEALGFAARPGALEGLAGKAIGLVELLAANEGRISLARAQERAVTLTRQYAKRQDTWFRNQFGKDWRRIATPDDFVMDRDKLHRGG